MQKILKLAMLLLFLPAFISAQMCEGKIIDKESGNPVQNVNVFLAGTSIGSTSNSKGIFSFNIKGYSSVPLVITFVGYKTKVITILVLDKDSVIRLERDSLQIGEIDVKSGKSGWSRKRMLHVFREEFLGTSFNAKACKMENEKDIYLFYNDDTKTLHANSKKPLIIKNKLLGYEVRYSLEYFRKTGNRIQFKGYSRFEEVEFKNDRQKKNVELERRVSYLGSIMHFIRFLYHMNLTTNDTIYDLTAIHQIYDYHKSMQYGPNYNLTGIDLNVTTIVSKNKINDIYLRKWEDKFQMYDDSYKYLSCKKLLADALNGRQIFYNDTVRIFYLGNLRTTTMIPKSDNISIYENGYYDPEKIRWYGEMSKNRVGDLLPLDYKYDPSILRN